MSPRRASLLAVCALVALVGCDRLKSMAGKGGADGGDAPSSGGGLLSLFGSDFEGEIAMTVTSTSSAAPTEMVFGIKKPRLRVDAPKGVPGAAGGGGIGVGAGKGAVLLLDPPQKKGWALSPADKKAVLFDFEKMKAMGPVPGMPGVGGVSGAKTPSAPPKFEKGGRDKVAGYACDVFKITHDNGKRSEVCIAEGITWVDLGDVGYQSPEIAAAAMVVGANHFPLRAVVTDASGVVETRMEATKVEKKKLDDAAFAVPPDFQVVDLAAMMGMLKGAGGGALPPGLVPPGALPPGVAPPKKAR